MPAGMRTSWQGGEEREKRRKALVPEGKHGAARGRYRNLRFLLSAAEERNQQPKQRPRSVVRNERQAEGADATIENRGGWNFIALTEQRSRRKTAALNDCGECVNAK